MCIRDRCIVRVWVSLVYADAVLVRPTTSPCNQAGSALLSPTILVHQAKATFIPSQDGRQDPPVTSWNTTNSQLRLSGDPTQVWPEHLKTHGWITVRALFVSHGVQRQQVLKLHCHLHMDCAGCAGSSVNVKCESGNQHHSMPSNLSIWYFTAAFAQFRPSPLPLYQLIKDPAGVCDSHGAGQLKSIHQRRQVLGDVYASG